MSYKYKVVGFDADDTLWVNEPYFRETEMEFCRLMKDFVPEEELTAMLFQIEMQNLALYGYGIKAFALSLIETALKVGNHQLSCGIMENIIRLGKDLLNKPVILLDGIETILSKMENNGTRLIVVTKGDLLDQERKLAKSGIDKYFHHVEIMSDKRETDYQKLLSRLGVAPADFLMIGNSLKSDVIPVLNIGGSAIHIPYHTTWQHESNIQAEQHHKYTEISHIDELINILDL
jgi:putative hydrolase of the HAD superfamily